MTVAKRIKNYLVEHDISQTWLSQRTAIPLPKLNLALNGNRKLQIEEFESIISVLNVPADVFIILQKSA